VGGGGKGPTELISVDKTPSAFGLRQRLRVRKKMQSNGEFLEKKRGLTTALGEDYS